MKKYLIIFTVLSIIGYHSIKQANAVLPAVAVAVAWFQTPLGIATATSAGLHASILAIKFYNDTPTNPDPANAPLTIQLDPNTPLIAESPPPPATTTASPNSPTFFGQTGTHGSFASAMANFQTVYQGYCLDNNQRTDCNVSVSNPIHTPPTSWQLNGNAGSFTLTTEYRSINNPSQLVSVNNNIQVYYANSSQVACPTGYTSSGGQNCNLTNPNAVPLPPNDKATVVRNGNQFQINPRDPDPLPSNVEVASNYVKVTNANGDETIIELQSDSSATVTTKRSNTSNNTTTVNQSNISSPNGTNPNSTTVTGSSSQTFNGIGSGMSQTPNPPTNNEGLECGDLACDASLQEILATLKGNETSLQEAVNSVQNANQSNSEALTDGAENTRSELFNDEALESGLDAIKDISPWWAISRGQSTGNCQPFNFSFMGAPYNIDLCPHITEIHNAMRFFFFIMTVLGVFSILTERPD